MKETIAIKNLKLSFKKHEQLNSILKFCSATSFPVSFILFHFSGFDWFVYKFSTISFGNCFTFGQLFLNFVEKFYLLDDVFTPL